MKVGKSICQISFPFPPCLAAPLKTQFLLTKQPKNTAVPINGSRMLHPFGLRDVVKSKKQVSKRQTGKALRAVLYYISQHFICWDFVGMTIQDPKIVGMDPNSLHPKPRPSTPRDSFDSILFQYQNEIV